MVDIFNITVFTPASAILSMSSSLRLRDFYCHTSFLMVGKIRNFIVLSSPFVVCPYFILHYLLAIYYDPYSHCLVHKAFKLVDALIQPEIYFVRLQDLFAA